MRTLALVLLSLSLAVTGCGSSDNTPPIPTTNTASPSNQPGNDAKAPATNSAEEAPEVELEPKDDYINVLNDFFSALEAMDGDALKKTLTSSSARGKGNDWAKELAELRKTVERLEITRRESYYEEEYEYWTCSYDFTLHMKNGKSDGEPNKEVWVMHDEDGKWRVEIR